MKKKRHYFTYCLRRNRRWRNAWHDGLQIEQGYNGMGFAGRTGNP